MTEILSTCFRPRRNAHSFGRFLFFHFHSDMHVDHKIKYHVTGLAHSRASKRSGVLSFYYGNRCTVDRSSLQPFVLAKSDRSSDG